MRLLATIIAIMLLAGCEDGSGDPSPAARAPETEVLAETETRTAIQIRKLTPAVATVGEPTTFNFEVAYSLANVPQGVINVGFNSWNANSYAFVSDKAIVDEGTGVVTFRVTTTPVKWDEPLTFKLNVSLSEYPHPSSWTPLATATEVIEVVDAPPAQKTRRAVQVPAHTGPLVGAGVAESCDEDPNLATLYCNQF